MKINIITHAYAKIPRIEKDLLRTIHVYVKEPPLEGKANNAIINALTNHFNVKRSDILLANGDKSKNKTFEILS